MSEETFGILRKLDMDGLETQVAIQCAPVLAGIKPSNLLNVRADRKEEAFGMFENSSIDCHLLCEWEGKISVLLYRRERLSRYLAKPEIRELLASFGYEDTELTGILERLSGRYQRHMEGGRMFPHEIGLVLGYPPEDVVGFIENKGENFTYSGYWKVYGNPVEARKIFEGYDRAREAFIRMAGSGMRIRDIIS